jgi:DNA-binding response OmpR family regulator
MPKILLADDHPDIRRLLEVSLRCEGHTILMAQDGQEALQIIHEELPDLVLLDVVMPEVDGFRVLNRIKTDPKLWKTQVVMLTVRDDPQDMTLGLDMGADYYLGKPFKPADVLSLVRRIFQSTPNQNPNSAA